MKISYKQLYKKDSVGKIRVWWMEQDDEKYRVCSGLLDGQIVNNEYTLAEPKNVGKKNETSAIEQATAEIKARYKKQLKTDYVESVENVDNIQFKGVMLARLFKDRVNKIDFSVKGQLLYQNKYNGNRCYATKDGLFTRKNERYVSVPHIEESLKQFFKDQPNAVLDGELFNYDLREKLNELSKLIRKTVNITPEDLQKSKKMVKYYLYDGYGFKMDSDWAKFSEIPVNDIADEAIPYYVRKQWMDEFIVKKCNYVEHVDTYGIMSEKHLNELYQKSLDDRQEGGMIRYRDMPYEHKRSKYLLKMKPEDDSEGKILAIKEGTGNWSGTAKTATIEWEGKCFDATFKGKYEELIPVYNNPHDWIGKVVTFKYNGLTGKGIPNFACIDVNNCLSIK